MTMMVRRRRKRMMIMMIIPNTMMMMLMMMMGFISGVSPQFLAPCLQPCHRRHKGYSTWHSSLH